jgi:hypothetical protein
MIVLDANILIRAILGGVLAISSSFTKARVRDSSRLTLPSSMRRSICPLSSKDAANLTLTSHRR